MKTYMMLICALALCLSACDEIPLPEEVLQELPDARMGDVGGAPEVDGRPTIHMPFAPGTRWLCTQGAEGSYSHTYNSTRYDVDFDTPNVPESYPTLYAPMAGIAFVHTNSTGFGYHVNIELDDGTYVVLGHMSQVDVQTYTYVEIGQALGRAGCTGSCTGEHVHVGVHRGSASVPASQGESIPFNIFMVDATAHQEDTGDEVWGQDEGPARAHDTRSLTCDVFDGHLYESMMPLYQGSDQGGEPAEDPEQPDEEPPAPSWEGDDPGECSDGADNDMDGLFDCDDADCAGAPVCQEPDEPEEEEPEEDPQDPPEELEEPAPPASDLVELCWEPTGLTVPLNGELWVKELGSWVTLEAVTGSFGELCGTTEALPGTVLTINGAFQALNVPGIPWWICSNTGQGYQTYGTLFIDGTPVPMLPDVWGTGCDALATVP